jgi:hypothetical protein
MSKDIKDFLQGVDNADAVAKIISDNLKDAKCKLFIDDGDKNIYVPKSRLDAKISELNTATQTITTLNASVKTLEAQVKDDDKAKETIKGLQTDLDNYKKALKDNQIDSALQMCALEHKAHDAKDLKGFLDMGKISISETGEVIGMKEQIENLKKEKAYLFEASEPDNSQQKPASPFNGTGVPGKQANGFVFNSQTAQPGDFGKMLAQQNGVPKAQEGKTVGPEYFFGENQ